MKLKMSSKIKMAVFLLFVHFSCGAHLSSSRNQNHNSENLQADFHRLNNHHVNTHNTIDDNNELHINYENSHHYNRHHLKRLKREADLKSQTFIIPTDTKDNTALFTTATDLTINANVQFRIKNESIVAANLYGRKVIENQQIFGINIKNGVVSTKRDLPSTGFTTFDLTIEVLRDNDVESRQPIIIKLVQRGWDQAVFTNQPNPLWTTIGVWNRPFDPIIRLQSQDAVLQSAHAVTYFIEHGDTSTFGVDENTGDVFIKTRKQFEIDDVYTLVVSAQSYGTRLATRAALAAATTGSPLSWIPAAAQPINVKVGTKPPQFNSSPLVLKFFENVTAGQSIGKVEATSFQDLPLTFSMSPPSRLFSLDGNSGHVTLNSELTYIKDERQYMHDVKVTEGHSNFESTTKLIFQLYSSNHPPTFPVPYYVKYNVPETTAVGTKLLEMVVRDYDPGEMGRLQTTVDDDTFAVEENNGRISLTVARPLDYESRIEQRYDMVVLAIDHGWPRLTGSTTIQIFVDNSNNRAPILEPENQVITIQEGARQNLVIHYIQAYDPDGDNIRFTFNKEPLTQEYFSVDEATGRIELIKDIEPGKNDLVYFNLSITITDDSSCCPGQASVPHSTQGYVGVKVYRVNTQPTFPTCRLYHPFVEENKEGSDVPILTLKAEDEDQGPNGELKFRIFGEEKNYFRVKQRSNGNEVELFLTQKISRDSAGVLKFNETFKYPVVVKAVDQGIPALSVNCFLFVTINTINLKAPRFDYGEQNAYFYVNSATPGDNIARVFAFDTDYGENGVVSYAFFDAPDSNYALCNNFFTLQSSTGWITWKGGPVSPPKTVKCEIQARDKGTPSKSSISSIYIQLTDNLLLRPPSWNPINNNAIDDLDFSIAENTPLESEVLTLSATIPYGSNIEFFLPAESIDVFNGKGRFGANSSSASKAGRMTILVKKILPEANLMPIYILRCRAFVTSKVNPLKRIASISRLKVKITDVNNQAPMFLGMDSNGVYTAAVTEFSKGGDFVVVVTAVDMDKSWPNNKISYSIQQGTGSDQFSIDSGSGQISVSTTATSATGTTIFNPNKRAFYEIVVVAEDGSDSAIPNVAGPNKVQVKVQITVNGGKSSSPSFDRTFSTAISEILPRYRHVINATASLPSDLPIGNSVVLPQYNIRGGNDGRVFAVDMLNGTLYKVGALDADKKSFYQLKYTAFDGIRVIGPVDINVTVTRSNYRPIIFDSSIYPYSGPIITEKDSNSVGTTIATVNTKSTNNNQKITYSITDPVKYSIDQSGIVKLRQPLSRDVPDGYAPQQVNVKAEAGGYSTGYALVTMELKDINDNKPLFDPCCVSGFVPENKIGNAFQLRTFDADAGLNKEVTFALEGSSDHFEVSPSGWVSTKRGLDFEAKQKYIVKVKATDKGLPPLSSESDISILVADVSEFPASFPQATYDVTMDEELAVGTFVTSLEAEDGDPMDNLTYSLLSSSGSEDYKFFFVENSRVFDGSFAENNARVISSAVLKVAKRIDYDSSKKGAYELILRAEDSTSRVTSTVVKVTVNDVNDNPPLISPPLVTSLLTGSAPVGKYVASFSATDPDSGLNGAFSFLIDYEHTDPRFNFNIEPLSGKVTLLHQFSHDTPSNLMVGIIAVDQGSPPKSGSATLNVTITDITRAPPPSPLSGYPVVIRPGATKNSQIYCLNNNNNNNNNNDYNYQLDCKGVQHCDDFTMNKDGCLVANRDGYSRKSLDYNSYNIPVQITNKNNNNNPDLVTRQNLRLVMQGTTDTPPQAAVKMVHVVNYVDADGGYSAIPLGNVYVSDVDDWDLHLKSFNLRSGQPYFSLNQDHKGKLFLRGDATPGRHEAEVEVSDGTFPVVVAKVIADVSIVNQTAVDHAASMRISGLHDVTDLLRTPTKSDKTRLDSIKAILASNLGENAKVEILSISNFNYEINQDGANASNGGSVGRQLAKEDANVNKENLVDVLYAARTDSRYFSPDLLNSLANEKKEELEERAGLKLLMAPVDMCRSEFYNCWSGGCVTALRNHKKQPALVNTNQTSFVGLSVDFQQKCEGMVDTAGLAEKDGIVLCVPGFCLNSGLCVVSNAAVNCVCPPGYEGQRCEMTGVSFVGPGGYMLLPALPQSEPFHLSLEILIPSSAPSTNLLLYSGPNQKPSQDSDMPIRSYYDNQVKAFVQKDFLLLELSNGRPRLRADFGDGEVRAEFPSNAVSSLVDAKWHSLDVIIETKGITMMIDNCIGAPIIENITSSTMDTSKCSVTVERPGERFLINTGGFPLQLGGRYDNTNAYPANWVKKRLRGCVRNLKVNSQLYDVSIGKYRAYESAESGCSYRDCAACPTNSSCRLLGPPGSPVCHCPPGFGGSQCQTPTATRYYGANEFVEWKPTNDFVRVMNSSQNWYSDNLQLMFRTRQLNGILFYVRSFTNLERYVLQLKDGVPHFKFDLGSNDEFISLNGVKVNDGAWHWIRAERHGNQVELRLDDGEGSKYNSTFPTNRHRYIKLFTANILGELEYNEWTKETKAVQNLEKTCISDVRYNGNVLSLTESSSVFSVTSQGGSDQGCDKSGACGGGALNCASGMVCVDLWQKAECRCEKFFPPGTSGVSNEDCISKSCFDSPCINGATCTLVDGKVVCICPPGYSGLSCEVDDVNKGGSKGGRNFNLVAAIVLPILLALLLLCLLLFLLWWCCCRNRERGLLYDEPDKDIRENVIAYDDEGAGEEDNYAFDLGRLKKSNLETENMKKSLDLTTIVPTLTASNRSEAPNRGLPGTYSNIVDFISDRMNDVDADPDNMNDDTQVAFDFEGAGSEAGTLSTLASSQGDPDVELDWLDTAGPRFGRLADMYGESGRV